MTFSYRIFNCIEHVDVSEWQRVRSACNGSIVMDPRFIAAVEVSMKQVEKFWYIVLYDEGGVAVLCTSASAMTVDLADLAEPGPSAHHPAHTVAVFATAAFEGSHLRATYWDRRSYSRARAALRQSGGSSSAGQDYLRSGDGGPSRRNRL